MTVATVFCFPGLGGYLPGALSQLSEHPAFASALAPVDQASREYGLPSYTEMLADKTGTETEDLAKTSIQLHLAAFATGVAVHAVLRAEGVEADAVLGLSTGEFTALAVSGCLSTYDAARVFCERELALSELDPGGGLVALEADPDRVVHLCGATGDHTLRPALINTPRQTAVSGRDTGLDALQKVARAAGVHSTRLLALFPYHNPLLAQPARRLAKATEDYALSSPTTPVYSPILKRYVSSPEDVREIISGHLVTPVHYAQAIQRLYAQGAEWFIESGTRSVLSELAAETLPSRVRLTSPLRKQVDVAAMLDEIRSPERTPVIPEQSVRSPEPPAPAAPPAKPAVERRWGRATAARPPAPAPTASVSDAPAEAPAPETERVATSASKAPEVAHSDDGAAAKVPARAELEAELRRMFADALGYPEDVFTEDAHLEADLGIASVRKTELLVQVLDKYDLPTPTSEIRVRDFNTLPKLADLMHLLAEQKSPANV